MTFAFTVAFAAVQAAAITAAASAERTEIVSLGTRPGVKLDFLLIEPKKPVSVLVLLEGGGGDLRLSGTQVRHNGFLATSRDRLAARGFIVALVDRPSDRAGERGMPAGFRSTGKHVKDIGSVIAWLKKKYRLPIWLLGVSRGTQSAAYVAIHTRESIDGLVLASSIAKGKGKSKSVPSMNLGEITVPTFIIAHKRDGCRFTPPEGAELIKRGLANAAAVEVRYFDGGRAAGKDPCKPRSYHTYHGIEDKVVAAIAGFVEAN